MRMIKTVMNSQGPNREKISPNARLLPADRKSSTSSPVAMDTTTQNEMTTHQNCSSPQIIRLFLGGALAALSSAEMSDILIQNTSATETQLPTNVNAKPVAIGFFAQQSTQQPVHPSFKATHP
jgi:hypothetical protein